jgi:glucose-1-phosphate thymidylyltransferase
MRIIIPMAGIGKRLRPHTLYKPKPLLPIAGKPIIERLVDEITEEAGSDVEEIAFIVGSFGEEVEQRLVQLAEAKGARGRIYYQPVALGTAHALSFAAESLKGEVIIAFADTLFKAHFKLDRSLDAIIWTKEVDDPRAFGVVELDGDGRITSFVEKPEHPRSNKAIIGVYYVRRGEVLRDEIDFIMANGIREKGEYQLTTCLDNMRQKGLGLYTAPVDKWLDCGNKQNTLDTNRQVLELLRDSRELLAASASLQNVTLNEPCFIGEDAVVKNSEIGPYVSIGARSRIENSVITNSIIQEDTSIVGQRMANSMIGSQVTLSSTSNNGSTRELSIGDFSSEIEIGK